VLIFQMVALRELNMTDKGSFWPDVSERIWRKTEELYMWEHA